MKELSKSVYILERTLYKEWKITMKNIFLDNQY